MQTRQGVPATLLLLNLDNFEEVHDAFAYVAGDDKFKGYRICFKCSHGLDEETAFLPAHADEGRPA